MSTILVVDDEPAIRELYTRVLTASGHLAMAARTAEEALDFLNLSPDILVVVADLDMPGKGGAWLVEQMRERFANVAVILATANQSVPGALSLQPGIVKYLVKPITGDHLRSAVLDAIAWQQQHASTPDSAVPADDPIEKWLDKKLTRGHGDGGTSEN